MKGFLCCNDFSTQITILRYFALWAQVNSAYMHAFMHSLLSRLPWRGTI